MDKPTTVTHIWDNGDDSPDCFRYIVVFSNERYAAMNVKPLDISQGKFWNGKGCPFRGKNEIEIDWDDLPSDCQEAVMIHLQEEEEAASAKA